LNRSQIARSLSDQTGLPPKISRQVLSAFIKSIMATLAAGEDVKIRNFGRLRVITSQSKTHSRENELHRRVHRRVRFKPSNKLRTVIEEPIGNNETVGLDALADALQRNLRLSEELQAIVEAHCEWLGSGRRKGQSADLSGYDLNWVDLYGAILKSANFARANLQNADLSDCDLEYANFEHANLTGASLAWANLRYANLRGACLIQTDLRLADLTGASLLYADLSRANLSGADLTGAVLEEAKLSGAQLKNTQLGKKGESVKSWFIQKVLTLNYI
jgi:nucleoid DNA-binding protein